MEVQISANGRVCRKAPALPAILHLPSLKPMPCDRKIRVPLLDLQALSLLHPGFGCSGHCENPAPTTSICALFRDIGLRLPLTSTLLCSSRENGDFHFYLVSPYQDLILSHKSRKMENTPLSVNNEFLATNS